MESAKTCGLRGLKSLLLIIFVSVLVHSALLVYDIIDLRAVQSSYRVSGYVNQY